VAWNQCTSSFVIGRALALNDGTTTLLGGFSLSLIIVRFQRDTAQGA
jgi:hypothetical protein